MIESPAYLDVSRLGRHAFGSRSLMWWGTAAFMVIEGVMFAMLVAVYAYLMGVEREWPPLPYAPPPLFWANVNVAIMLASLVPNHFVKLAVEALDVRRTRRWMLADDAFGIAFLVVRGLEMAAMNVRWDSNAYGSIVWLVLGFHTFHMLTDEAETWVLTWEMWRKPSARRMVDVSEDTLYWEFVVLSWLPLYLLVYWVPRWT